MTAKFRNIGQACTAANRFIVHESVAADFTDRVTERVRQLVVGPGVDEGVNIGPLINPKAVQSNDELVADAVSGGATVTTGGHPLDRPGNFYSPTVLTGVGREARMLKEEIFGPVLGVTTFSDDDDAIRLANDTEYGLVSYAYTRDLGRRTG